MEPLLELKNLSVSFLLRQNLLKQTSLLVMDDLSFAIHSGEIIALVGESGCGKSVLIKSILGILPTNSVFSGSMCYQGLEIPYDKRFSLAQNELIYLPQTVSHLNPLLKMEKQISLDESTLAEKSRGRYPFECSGGMLKQVLFCVTKEKKQATLLLADEPTMGIDTETAIETVQFFKEFKKDGKSVLFVTHDIDLAVSIADKIAVYWNHSIVEVLNSADFSADNIHSCHSYTQRLFHSLPQHRFQ